MAIAIWVFIAIMVFIAFVRYALSPSKRKGPEEDKCRYGFISFSCVEMSPWRSKEHSGIIRVKELEHRGEYCRLEIIGVSGCNDHVKKAAAEQYEGWIKDSGIKWDTEGQEV